MTPILAFDIETVPDIAGLRLLRGLDAKISDRDIAEHALQQRRAQTGNDFMPLHLHRVVAMPARWKETASAAGRWAPLTTARESWCGASSTESKSTLRNWFPGTAAGSICRCFTTAVSCTACRRRATGNWATRTRISGTTTTSAAITSATSTSWKCFLCTRDGITSSWTSWPGSWDFRASSEWTDRRSGKRINRERSTTSGGIAKRT